MVLQLGSSANRLASLSAAIRVVPWMAILFNLKHAYANAVFGFALFNFVNYRLRLSHVLKTRACKYRCILTINIFYGRRRR